MHVTQHFMNIISPEQINTWKSPEEKSQQSQMNQVLTCKVCDESFASLKELSTHIQKTMHFKDNNLLLSNKGDTKLIDKDRQSPSGLSTTSSTSTTGGLSNNDQSLSNGNQQKKRNSSNGSSNNQTSSNKEKRKKSLPVRKLLELERNVPGSNGQTLDSATSNNLSKSLLESMNRLFGGGANSANDKFPNGYNLDALSTVSNEESENSLNASTNSNQQQQSITCDECKESMDLNQFIMHLKHCKSQLSSGQNAQLLNLIMAAAQQQEQQSVQKDNKSPINNLDDSIEDEDELDENLKLNGKNSKKESSSNQNTPERSESRQSTASSGHNSNRATPQLNGSSPKSTEEKKTGSVLSALEQLIEKSFDSKSKKSTNNQGILQRLGIDEEVNPPWQTNLNANSPPSTTASNAANNSFFPWSP